MLKVLAPDLEIGWIHPNKVKLNLLIWGGWAGSWRMFQKNWSVPLASSLRQQRKLKINCALVSIIWRISKIQCHPSTTDWEPKLTTQNIKKIDKNEICSGIPLGMSRNLHCKRITARKFEAGVVHKDIHSWRPHQILTITFFCCSVYHSSGRLTLQLGVWHNFTSDTETDHTRHQ